MISQTPCFISSEFPVKSGQVEADIDLKVAYSEQLVTIVNVLQMANTH